MFEQLIYTSCKTGIKNQGTGFQVYSCSKGLDNELMSEICKNHCSYKEPSTLPRRPSEQEIKELFPKSYKYDLSTDNLTAVFSRTRYIGQDYMGEGGRFGVFLSHVISCDTSEMDFLPVECCFSGAYIDDLSFDEKNANTPPEHLPSISKVQFLRKNDLYREVHDFLFGNTDCISKLEKMLDALIESASSRKSIVICDDKEHIPYWFAAITMLLPLNYAKKITFDTYVESPQYSGAKLMGVYPEGTGYNVNELSQSCYIFDFLSDTIIGASNSYKYSQLICDSFVIDRKEIDEFNEFLANVGFTDMNHNIDNYYEIFEFYKGTSNSRFENSADIIQLSEKLCNDKINQLVYDTIVDDFDTFIDYLTPELADIILNYILSCEDNTVIRKQSGFLQKAFSDILLVLVNEYERFGETTAEEIYSKYVNKVFENEEEFLTELFYGDLGERVFISLEDDNIFFHTFFYAEKLFKYLRKSNIRLVEALKNPLIKRIINNTLITYQLKNNVFVKSIESYSNDAAYDLDLLKTLVTLIYSSSLDTKSSAIEEVITAFLKNHKDTSTVMFVIGILGSIQQESTALNYIKELISNNESNFDLIMKNERLASITKKHIDEIVKEYISIIKQKLELTQYKIFLIDFIINNIELLKTSIILKSIIKEIAFDFEIKITDDFDFVKLKSILLLGQKLAVSEIFRIEIFIYLNELHIILTNNKYSKQQIWNKVQDGISSTYIKSLTQKEHESLAKKFIPLLCNHIETYEHQCMIFNLFIFGGNVVLLDLLTTEIISVSKRHGESVLIDHFAFLVEIKQNKIDCITNMENLKNAIYKLPKDSFAAINKEAQVMLASKDITLKTWNKIYAQLQDKKSNSFGNKFFEFITGGKKDESSQITPPHKKNAPTSDKSNKNIKNEK